MTSTFFDIGDEQRLEREARLTEQLPRQPLAEDRSPSDSILMDVEREADEFSDEPENDFDMMLEGLLAALIQRRT